MWLSSPGVRHCGCRSLSTWVPFEAENAYVLPISSTRLFRSLYGRLSSRSCSLTAGDYIWLVWVAARAGCFQYRQLEFLAQALQKRFTQSGNSTDKEAADVLLGEARALKLKTNGLPVLGEICSTHHSCSWITTFKTSDRSACPCARRTGCVDPLNRDFEVDGDRYYSNIML